MSETIAESAFLNNRHDYRRDAFPALCTKLWGVSDYQPGRNNSPKGCTKFNLSASRLPGVSAPRAGGNRRPGGARRPAVRIAACKPGIPAYIGGGAPDRPPCGRRERMQNREMSRVAAVVLLAIIVLTGLRAFGAAP